MTGFFISLQRSLGPSGSKYFVSRPLPVGWTLFLFSRFPSLLHVVLFLAALNTTYPAQVHILVYFS